MDLSVMKSFKDYISYVVFVRDLAFSELIFEIVVCAALRGARLLRICGREQAAYRTICCRILGAHFAPHDPWVFERRTCVRRTRRRGRPIQSLQA